MRTSSLFLKTSKPRGYPYAISMVFLGGSILTLLSIACDRTRILGLDVINFHQAFFKIFYCHDFLVQDKCALHKILLTFIFRVFNRILKTFQLFVITGILFLHVFISSLFQSLRLKEVLIHDWSSSKLLYNQHCEMTKNKH